MKKLFCIILAIAALSGVLFFMKNEKTEEKKTVRAIWISQYDISSVLTENGHQRNESNVRAMLDTVFDNCISLGFNTVFLQVRPNGDSLYPSELFAPSVYAVGTYGNEFSYDPFAIAVASASSLGLSVHAWINPLRLMRTEELARLDESNILRSWHDSGEYIFEHEGRLYLDPAYPEVRSYIAAGALEVASHYDIDGVHMDDYFYPHEIGDIDAASYKKFGASLSLADFRRDNVTKLIMEINSALKSHSHDLTFGISPGGNLETLYNTDYADVARWCDGGYIDYICPQIYFGLEHETHAFDELYLRWAAIPRDANVKLYVGITFGKAEAASLGIGDKYAGTGQNEWINNRRVLADCLEFLKKSGAPDGISVFCYQYLFDPVSGEKNDKTEAELDSFLPVWKDF